MGWETVRVANLPLIMTAPQVAELFGVSSKTVARWASKGALKGFRTPGGHRRFRREEVLTLYNECIIGYIDEDEEED